MRTTLTLDPDVARLLEDEVRLRRKPFKQVVNDAIRRGLGPRAPTRAGRYRVKAHHTTLLAGIDPGQLNTLADDLETEAVVEKVRRGAR